MPTDWLTGGWAGKLLYCLARNKKLNHMTKRENDILSTRPPIQCERTSFLASFTSSAGKKTIYFVFIGLRWSHCNNCCFFIIILLFLQPVAADEDWSVDTSEEAVQKRMGNLTSGVKGLALTDDAEKPQEERFNLLYSFVKVICNMLRGCPQYGFQNKSSYSACHKLGRTMKKP